jgi:hypothetical protein
VAGKSIPDIGYRQDASLRRYGLPAKPIRVTAAIQPLVVMPNACQMRRKRAGLTDDLVANKRVAFNQLALLGAKPTGLLEDGFRHPYFTNVVQQPGDVELVGFF